MSHPTTPAPAPLLTAALVCDAAVRDKATSKISLIGIYDELRTHRYPAQRPFSVYFRVVDAEGVYTLQLRLVERSTNAILGEFEHTVTIEHRLRGKEFFYDIEGVALPAPGVYEFQCHLNGTYVGCATLAATLWAESQHWEAA